MKGTAEMERTVGRWLDTVNAAGYRRLAGFAAVGLTTFFAGAALLFGLVHYAKIEPHVAYLITAAFSIEANFALNRTLNWRDRGGRLRDQLLAFHAAKITTIILNQVLFALLLAAGVWYMAAMVLITGLIMVVNFLANDRFVFRVRTAEPAVAPRELEAGSYS